jgi:hypothetical protein
MTVTHYENPREGEEIKICLLTKLNDCFIFSAGSSSDTKLPEKIQLFFLMM